ncbi:hypothetical protein ACR30L_12550 [Psychromonas sp. PT13]|uniref:hypothetical protein n=1 Tax=Psychromonas sp. PT13 TaxID=3439547 RepID=UPI003EBBCECA
MQFKIRILLVLLIGSLLSACSTRESTDKYKGSTSQRLLTYSINDLMVQIPSTDFNEFEGKPVYVQSHFIERSPVLTYATQRLYAELTSRFNLNLVNSPDKADYQLDFFFTSLGTDSDTFGLTIPIFWVDTSGETSYLDVLAVHMYHGVSEMYYYTKNTQTGKVKQHPSIIARAKTDRFSTPIFSFSMDDLEEKSILE